MKNRSRFLSFAAGVIVALSLPALAATFRYFSPATGILVGDATSYITSAATSSNVIALWGGTCDGTTFLRGDGDCAAGGGGSGTTGSFTLTWTDACTASPTTLIEYTLDDTNTVVTWLVNPMSVTSCTSDSTSFTTAAGDVPANLRPTTNDMTIVGVRTVDNGTTDAAMGCLTITTTGVVLVRRSSSNGCLGGWTGSGAKAVNGTGTVPTTVTYRLDP